MVSVCVFFVTVLETTHTKKKDKLTPKDQKQTKRKCKTAQDSNQEPKLSETQRERETLPIEGGTGALMQSG